MKWSIRRTLRTHYPNFYELQDFFSKFYIVANICRKEEFNDKISVSMYSSIKSRVQFLDYERVVAMHANLKSINNNNW